jgi:asparagine synthase (glutamine-hydrolysing)
MRTDKMGMANSIEIRVPFLDKALVEFALAAPLAWKLRDGVSKEPLKRLATDWTTRVVPRRPYQNGAKSLYYRPKSGFGAPIRDWFSGALGQDFRSRLIAAREQWEPLLNVAAVVDELSAPPATENRSYQLWTLYMALVWRERFDA